jgi:hypothetical protein
MDFAWIPDHVRDDRAGRSLSPAFAGAKRKVRAGITCRPTPRHPHSAGPLHFSVMPAKAGIQSTVDPGLTRYSASISSSSQRSSW